MRVFRSASVILVVLILSACSRTELVYNNADWLIYRWADGLLDAEGDQAERWRALFGQVMTRHRRELLPDVVTLLHRVSEQTKPRLTPTGLACVAESTERLLTTHARLLVDPAAEVLSGISPAQLAHLQAELDERNRDYRERFLQADPQQRETARFERFVERIERWTGDLTTEQLRLVRDAVRNMPDLAGDWLAYREQQQDRLIALLGGHADKAGLRVFLTDWWVHRRDRDARLTDRFGQVRNATLRLILALDDNLDDGQRAYFQRRVSGMRDDLAGLIDGRFDVAKLRSDDDACAQRHAGAG